MLKNYEKEIGLLQKLIDLIAITSCWVFAYFLRFHVIKEEHLWYGKYIFVIWWLQYFFYKREGLYSSQRLRTLGREAFSVLKANTLLLIFFVIAVYFFSPEKISRIVLINFSVLSTVIVVLIRVVTRMLVRKQRAQGKNLRYVVLVGDGKQLEEYLSLIKNHPEIGLRIRAWVDSNGIAERNNIPSEASFSRELIQRWSPDYLIVGYAYKDYAKLDVILNECSTELVNITILPDLSYALVGHEMSDLSGIPAININQPSFRTSSIIIKRIFDFILSGVGLVFISPLLAFIALGVKLSSPGPVFFGQKRVGLDGKEFLMWKFRSMKVDSESKGAGWTTSDDPRKTKFGSFIRKTSLDELPQLWNVFIGEMSLVGPRPEQPYFVNKFKGEIPSYMLRHKMKAGITGWAQVNGWRGDTSITSRIECDIWYIKNWSIGLDVTILFLTFWKGFVNKNAY